MAPVICALAMFLLIPASTQAQMVIGQYSDEAPLRTWNNFGLLSSISGGMGNVRFTLVDDAAAGSVNPSLPALGDSFQLAVSGSMSTVSLNRYGIVNTGVLVTQSHNASGRFPMFDAAALSFRWRNWGISIGYGPVESYARPETLYEAGEAGQVYYRLEFLQRGLLRNYNLSLSRAFGPSVSIGMGVNVIDGNWEKSLIEERRSLNITISDEKTERFSGLYFTGGITVRPLAKLTLAGVFRSPFTRKSQGISLSRYESPFGGTDIQIPAESDNLTDMPAVAGIGLCYAPTDSFRIATDLTLFFWNSYRFEYFEETFDPGFKNTLTINSGFEFLNRIRLFGRNLINPLRVGFIYDPQPMLDPNSRYLYLTLGTGLRWPHVSVDFGTMFGWEFGSGDNLTVYRSFISMTVHPLKGDLR